MFRVEIIIIYMFSKTFALLALILVAQAAQVPLQIIHVSSEPTALVTPIYSSLRGGKMIYIKAIGHSPDPTDNLVYVGVYPCTIPADGVTDTFISCETGDTGSTTSINNLPVTLISTGTFYTTYQYVVSYKDWITPQLKIIYPSAGFAASNVNFYGVHQITDLGDGLRDMGQIIGLRMGQDLCSRFDIFQEPISANSHRFIRCTESSSQEAGKYNVTEHVIVGYANNDMYMRRASSDPTEYFEFTALPTIASVSPNTGNIGGQYLTLKGTGFSPNLINNTVTVDGNDCKVTAATNDQIKCTLAQRNNSLSSQLTTNTSGSQVDGFFSGAGLKYARYTISTSIDTLDEFVTATRNGNTGALGTPDEVGWRADMREPNIYSYKEAQSWRGYFTAPSTGNYTFRGSADDSFRVYISSTHGSAEVPALNESLIYSSGHQKELNFYEQYRPTAEGTVEMTGGKSYYLEAYHLDSGGGTGYFYLDVEVPNSNPDALYQSFEVGNITLDSVVQPEIKVYTIDGLNLTGTIQLRVFRQNSNLDVTYDKSVNITYGCSEATFKSALENFDGFQSYQISVVRTIYASNNSILPDTTDAAKIEYQVSFYKLRSNFLQGEEFKTTSFNGFAGTFSEAQTQTHSPLVSGTFQLSIGGVAVQVSGSSAISYDVGSSALQTAIRNSGVIGFDYIEVSKATTDGCVYSCSWIIEYKGFNQAIPSVVVNAASLTGGIGSPTTTYSTVKPFSSNIVFSPVDYRFTNTADAGINVQVKTNGIPAICTGTCGYTFNGYTEITALSYSGTTLSFALSDPLLEAFTAADVTVSVGGKVCLGVTGAIGTLTCTMEANTDGTPILVAGLVTPLVVVSQYGIAGLASGVSPLNVPLGCTSLSVISGGNNGGYLISLTGTGFPLDKKLIDIKVCNNSATINTINNINVAFFVPACSVVGAQNVEVTVGADTCSNVAFTYNDGSSTAPTISQLSPTSANHGVKGVLQIFGTNFGSDPSAAKVHLSNATGKIYQLPVLTINDSYIKAGLPGGREGDYIVEVNLPTIGDSIAAGPGTNAFSYKFTVSSISPTSGSYHGNTLLTITGQNFVTAAQQTLAYVGFALNWFCTIQSITATEIQCRTPKINRLYKPGEALKVVVSTRLLILNYCTGTCDFSYINETDSPTIASLSSSTVSISGSSTKTITITGTNLVDTNNFADVTLTHTISNQVIVITPSSVSDTSVVFDVTTAVVSGKYQVRTRNAIGGSNSKEITVNWNVGTVSWSSGGSTSGAVVNITGGGGYPSSIDGHIFSVSIFSGDVNYPFKLVSCCASNQISFEIPSAVDGTSLSIKFQGPINTVTKTYLVQTSRTPTGTINNNPYSVGTQTVSFTDSGVVSTSTIHSINLVSVLNSSQVINVPSWSTAGAVTTFSVGLYTGAYNLLVNTNKGYMSFGSNLNVGFPNNTNNDNGQISFNGGKFKITGTKISPGSHIEVNGFKGFPIAASDTQVTYQLPPFITTLTQSTFNLASTSLIDNKQLTFFSDVDAPVYKVDNAFDDLTTSYYDSNNTECWLGVDAGVNMAIKVDRIRFFPNLAWDWVNRKILYATFEGSNDMSSWTTLATLIQTIHTGWNVVQSTDQTPFRYIRFKHNATSRCNLAQFQVYGILESSLTATLTSTQADVIYKDGFNTQTFTNAAEFRQDTTPIVTAVSPRYGQIFGGYTLTLTGQYLNVATAVVTIDGVDCAVTAATASQITCTVGARSSTYNLDNTFTVYVGNSAAILRDSFLYVLKWSNPLTWGVDMPPVDNDLIYVPKGTTLYVDQDTPILEGIAVEGGTLVFADEGNLTVQAGFITMNGGRFIAGTEQHPHTNPLTFIMYGGYYGKQQPMFGNKGIGCKDCKFSMHGAPRTKTWSSLSATVSPNATQLTVVDTVDWQVGEEIVVASTSFEWTEAERKTITAISNRTITVDTPFQFQHIAVVQTHGTDLLEMRAEVGLLTRNIKMRGDAETSVSKMYGSHLLLTGDGTKGFEGHIAYTQFFHCGQPQIMGRYCMHFHMAGAVPTSYSKGNAVHDSFARIQTIHGVHFLTVEDNVGYKVRGHNFFVEDGIETHNVIRNNLAIGSIAATNMLQTDTSVASFWITNPTNDVYGNHAAGGDFYGIWYQIKPRPDGPSATMDVCPIGNPLGNVYNNVAHSNTRFGLRLFKLQPRTYPCQPIRNDSNPDDPWLDNPSVQSKYYNFTIYKNLQNGVLAEEMGNIVFQNFIIAENYNAGIQFFEANFTKEAPVIRDSAIIGMSTNNAHSITTNYSNGMSTFITGKTGRYNISNVRVFNYPAGSLVLKTCRFCDDPLKYTNLGTDVYINQLSLSNIQGSYLKMLGLQRCIVWDTDGSFSQAFDGTTRANGGTIVHGFNHIKAFHQSTCPQATTASEWDNAIYCDHTETVRRIVVTNMLTHSSFLGQPFKVTELASINDTSENISSTLYTSVHNYITKPSKQPKKEKAHAWSLPYLTGNTYNVWWGTGIDFSHMALFTTPLFSDTDDGIIFKFNYTQNRELFQVGSMSGGVKQLTKFDYLTEQTTYLDAATCQNGQYFHDNSEGPQRMMEICQSGKNRTKWQYTDVNGIICRYLCPAPPGTFVRQKFVRLWSNATQWPGGVLPAAGDSVNLHGNWTVRIDVDIPVLNQFVIDGVLIADDSRDVNITANWIHIRAGNLTAGSASSPFLHNFVIQVNGNKHDSGYYIDPILAGNKHMVVSGTLNIHGVAPPTVHTYLKTTAMSGDSTITVNSASGWALGDTIVIAPSFSAWNQYERRTITAISSNTITLNESLAHTHYGSSSKTINNHYGQLDTRARVGHVNRNVKIVPGPDAGWGFSVTVYGYKDQNNNTWIGNAEISGVQFEDGGQLDTLNSPLKFLNTRNGKYKSKITDTSFLNCKANCIYMENAYNITISNNVFYNVWVHGIQTHKILDVKIDNNIFMGITYRPTVHTTTDVVACVGVFTYPDPTFAKVLVRDNFCQGSSKHGFAVTFVKCGESELNPFANNTAGSCGIGWILNTNGQQCQEFSYAKAYACSIGQICGSPGISKIIMNQFIMADNGRGVTLKLGAKEGGRDHTAQLLNSYITAISRPSCSYCYGSSATKCTGLQGTRILTASANGQVMPAKSGSGFDVICKQPVFDSKNFLYNNTFEYFRQNYTESALQTCGSNFALKPHSLGDDTVGSANLYDSKCINCDGDSYLKAPSPNPNFIGWFGGCGDIVCTGFENYLIQDWTGTFFGQVGTIVPSNDAIGTNETNCTKSDVMNAYMCLKEDFAVLEYQSKAADFNTRIMWPVSLTSDQNPYTTLTNAWRQWQWLGHEPMNRRIGRFVSIVTLNNTYNMTFLSQPPHKIVFQIQQRKPTGNPDNWINIRLHYPRPNSIRLLLNGAIVDPILLTDVNHTTAGLRQDLNRSVCGSHAYLYNNYTISFILTEDPNCYATVELTESIQLTTHFAMNVSDFFSSTNIMTNFINNLCALLNIVDTSRVKVVGVHSGSTTVTTVISPTTNATVTTSNGTNTTDQTLPQIQSQLNSNSNSANFSNSLGAAVGSTVLSFSSSYYPLTVAAEEESSNIGIIAGLVVAALMIVVAGVITFVYCVRRRSKITEMPVSEDESLHDKEGNNPIVMTSENRNVMRAREEKNSLQYDKENMIEERFD